MFTEYYHYTERLLSVQYDVSEMIKHSLTRGEVREYFLKDVIEKTFNNSLELQRGILDIGEEYDSQIDLAILREKTISPKIGDKTLIDPENCLMILEVKSNAKGKEMTDFMFIRKNTTDGRYILSVTKPVIKEFLKMIQGLLR